MKFLGIFAAMGAASLCLLGVVMAKTNPTPVEYEEYAAQRLTLYLKENGCGKAENPFEKFITANCDRIIDEANPTIRSLLNTTTQRYDFVLFSLYRTNLKVSQWIPGYQFETLGAFNNFYIYSAKQN